MAETNETVAALVDRMPDVDGTPPDPARTGKFTGPSPENAREIFQALLEGGREALRELVGMIRAPGDPDFQNYKAGYVLHGLANHVGGSGREDERQLFGSVLAAAIEAGHHSKSAKALLIQELERAGAKEAVPALAKQLLDPDLSDPAVRALLAIGQDATEQLRNGLRAGKGKARLKLVQAVGEIRDAGSVALLTEALRDDDLEMRVAAAWALANIAEASAADAVLECARQAKTWERIQVANAGARYAENLHVKGNHTRARRLATQLRAICDKDSEPQLREAVESALRRVE